MALVLNGSGITSANIADGTIVSGDIADGTIAVSDVADNAITEAKIADAAVVSLKSGRKNLIINGGMRIDQRNNGVVKSVTGWGDDVTDRFRFSFRTATGTASAQQVTDAPVGFKSSLKLTRLTATSPAANDYYNLLTKIEGNDISHTEVGKATAKTVTASFWVKSSLTGTYSVGFQNEDGGDRRSYVTEYTINTANTWERKTFTTTLDTGNTWHTDNRAGIQLNWGFGNGSAYQTSTLNTWQSNNVLESSNQSSFMATAGATWQITGVQLEVGSVATDFEHRSYGEELALCQRYYFTTWKAGTAIGTNIVSTGNLGVTLSGTTSKIVTGGIGLPVEMRDIPTILIYSPTGVPDKYYERHTGTDLGYSSGGRYAGTKFIGLAEYDGAGSENREAYVHIFCDAEL